MTVEIYCDHCDLRLLGTVEHPLSGSAEIAWAAPHFFIEGPNGIEMICEKCYSEEQ